jgi:hypothetical protein
MLPGSTTTGRADMRMRAACLVCLPLLVVSLCAGATAQRTFVASYGLTANTAFNCSLAKPCRAFNEAIGVTLAGGEVIVLDSAGYGTATIGKSITIAAPPGVYAGISVGSGDGIVVNAGASDVVNLRGLVINGTGGTNGVVVNTAGLVNVNDVRVSGFTFRGMNFAAPDARLNVTDSLFERSGESGLHAQAASGTQTITIHRSRFDRNAANGAVIATNATGAIFDTVASNNASVGFLIDAGGIATLSDCKVSDTYDFFLNYGILVRGSGTKAMIARCDVFGAFGAYTILNGAHAQITDSSAQTGGWGYGVEDAGTVLTAERSTATNLQSGFYAFGGAILRMSNCTSTSNTYGIVLAAGGLVESRQNNTVRGNFGLDLDGEGGTFGTFGPL